ncbi:acyl-CoA dehydrogenase family protein [Massilia antarctica]|uniref:acyl-CoA dehydrogenase family protein n=1 Tax=Massilia antarctica TaxID=2765360 RepID=UPI0006BD6F24|nr:acyl-CoA dehydrogenase family protein [Massilia sp. H27-R4]CUI09766.1 Butyryl-CoA dehydrogenase [Janthinobacterium sp. CG23_2]CUU33552.1 Butyryl-CoA dehydrogenase [Janthinobacterium sp. CG23_2]
MCGTSPWMTEELEGFRDAVRRFVASEVAPLQQRWREQQHVDRDLWHKGGAMGILCADIPEQYGGSGGSFAHQAIVFEELGYCGDMAFGIHVHAIVAHYLLNQGTEAQKLKYLPKLASGEMVAAIAMSEPGAGSDLKGIRTSAVRTADGYKVNGSKTFISNGYLADLVVVVVKTDADAGAKGVSLLLMETKDNPGFRVGRILEKVGQKGQDTCELFFDDAHVALDNVLGGAEGQGFAQLMTELPYERTILGVAGVAAIERALRLTIDHTRERRAFGQALIDMQNTRFVLAEIKTEATIARIFIDRCTAETIAGRMDTVTASMAKYWISDLQCKVIDQCVQLFGGYGYMLEYPIAQMYVDARVQRIYGGANEIMKEIIARSL